MDKNPALLYKILVVGIIVLFLGVAVQSGLAIVQTKDINIEYLKGATEFNGFNSNFNSQLSKEEIKEFEDISKDYVNLDFFHDVGIKNIDSPKKPWKIRTNSFTYVPPYFEVYIQPGTEDIDVTIVNNGTFPEYNLTCYAEIYEYITDPENGTLVYEHEITNIDLEEPNGGTKLLNFDDYTFANEGIYCLFIELPLEIDDYPGNNHKELVIGVDDTNPDCDYPPIFDPPEPNGWNGWYISNVNVTINASDPWSNDISSGVKEIRYTINGGAENIIDGNNGSFIITQDGNDVLVEYWAIDWVGNVESTKNSFTIDIDKTCPETSISYEILGWSPMEGWEYQLTIIANDDMSGICLILLFFNDEFVEEFTGNGPEYVWTFFCYPSHGNNTIKLIVLDCAGNIKTIEITLEKSLLMAQYIWLFNRLPLLKVIISQILGL